MKSIFTGQLGFVLIPENKVEHRAVELTSGYKYGSSIDLGGQHMPHITLYHAELENVPISVVFEFLNGLAATLPLSLSFTNMASFGGKFLFWDVERSDKLVALHEYALGLSKYFVAPTGESQIDREKITLSSAESENMTKFGHPLVGELWRPHITLGYYPSGVPYWTVSEKFEGSTALVAFARIGEFGTVSKIIVSTGP